MEKVRHKYAISGGHAETVKAAEEVLLAGGNAVDAAIAAYWLMFVSEPCMASIGAGGFAHIKFGDTVVSLDFFCQTPLQKRPSNLIDFYPITVDFGNTTEDFHIGRGSTAVPGAVAGMFALHERFGSIPMTTLMEPAIHAAKEGIAVDHFQAYDLKLLEHILSVDPMLNEVFFNQDGLKREGDIIRLPDFADFAYVLAREGKALVYEGEIARQVAKDYEEDGSLSYADLLNYKPIWRRPLNIDWLGKIVSTTPAPSMGGILIAALLKSLEKEESEMLSNRHFSKWADTMETVFKFNSDLPALYKYMEKKHSVKGRQITEGGQKPGGTSHFNIIDDSGNAIALTTSIGEGNGYFVPGTQMQMNNMLGEAALLPNGFHSWKPNHRLQSMMTPTMVLDPDGEVCFVTGSGGAGRIPFAISQSLMYYFQKGLNLSQAIHAPKIYFNGNIHQVEAGFNIPKTTKQLNIWEHASLYFGGTHSISKEGEAYLAVADKRRHGSAVNC